MSTIQLEWERCSEGGADGTRHSGITESTHCLLPAVARSLGRVPTYFSSAKQVTFSIFLFVVMLQLKPRQSFTKKPDEEYRTSQKESIDVLHFNIGSILKNKKHSSGDAALLSYSRLEIWQ